MIKGLSWLAEASYDYKLIPIKISSKGQGSGQSLAGGQQIIGGMTLGAASLWFVRVRFLTSPFLDAAPRTSFETSALKSSGEWPSSAEAAAGKRVGKRKI